MATTKKILFLHGYMQSGDLFLRKVSGLRKALKKEFGYFGCFPDGPVQVHAPDSADPEERARLYQSAVGEEMFGWWVLEKGVYAGAEKTFPLLREYMLAEGPFEGVVGFSQGAAVAAALCAAMPTVMPDVPPLKFGVFYSGFLPEAPFRQYFETKLAVPSLHVLGSVDTLVSEERTLALYDACAEDTRTLYRHPGGHFVPNSKDTVAVITGWVRNATAPPAPATPDDDGWESA
ncbi:serine hydrolase FSH [Dipodascopsis tothii]|uniref:serine hydrolase FSH n=1 Tax=Dipodascopsis tothii TaxID=44089 RepID=UPI0034CDA4D3